MYPSDIAFTDRVKAIQSRKGSRDLYAAMEQKGGWQTDITPELEVYLTNQRSFYLATSNRHGQPYIQHRGGPPGFLHIIDRHTLAFADFKGNRQYISQGNLSENPRAFIFLMDYLHKTRIKIWGTARVIEDQPERLAKLMPPRDQYRALPEQIIEFTVKAWDRNCPQHIPLRVDAEDVEQLLKEKQTRIEDLEKQLCQLKKDRP